MASVAPAVVVDKSAVSPVEQGSAIAIAGPPSATVAPAAPIENAASSYELAPSASSNDPCPTPFAPRSSPPPSHLHPVSRLPAHTCRPGAETGGRRTGAKQALFVFSEELLLPLVPLLLHLAVRLLTPRLHRGVRRPLVLRGPRRGRAAADGPRSTPPPPPRATPPHLIRWLPPRPGADNPPAHLCVGSHRSARWRW